MQDMILNAGQSAKSGTDCKSVLLLAMTTCFMSNQIFRIGGGLWFLFDSHALLLYRKLLLVIPRQYYAILWLRSNSSLELVHFHYLAYQALLLADWPGN